MKILITGSAGFLCGDFYDIIRGCLMLTQSNGVNIIMPISRNGRKTIGKRPGVTVMHIIEETRKKETKSKLSFREFIGLKVESLLYKSMEEFLLNVLVAAKQLFSFCVLTISKVAEINIEKNLRPIIFMGDFVSGLSKRGKNLLNFKFYVITVIVRKAFTNNVRTN